MAKSLKKNAVWNFIYTGTNLLFPLLTAPYITRVLGASNLGEVNFAKSFVQWFLIFGEFGITTYGVRIISQVRNKQNLLNKAFSELIILNIIFSIMSGLFYLILIFNNEQFLEELPLFIIMSLSIILNAVNIDWFYQGIEEYNYITLRNFIIKVISLTLIFVFIKDPSDYVIYGFISVLGTGVSGVLNIINSRNYVTFTLESLDLVKHLKPRTTFLLTTFVINIYTNLDRTLLGFVDTSESVAFLTIGKSVVNMGGSVATSIASVAMPRASYFLHSDFTRYKNLVEDVPKFMQILTIPMAIGIVSLAPEIMYILGGEEFMEAYPLLILISPVVVFSTLSTFLSQQVLVPTGNENYGLVSSIISGIVSVVANIILIPRYSYMGAGIALVLAELSAVITRYIFTKKIGYNFIRLINKSIIKYFIASGAMIFPIYIVKENVDSVILTFVLSAISGAAIYLLALWLLREEILTRYFKRFMKKIIER